MPEEERKRPKRRKLTASVLSATSTPAVVIDPKMQQRAFFLRANAVPLDEIAEILGLTEAEAASAIQEHATKLNNSEINSTETARRVQIEQLDMALRQLMPFVTGYTQTGEEHGLNLDRMDQFLKILDQKAKLTGINSPQRIDIGVRLRRIAEETGEFEYEELVEILRDVLRDFPQLGVGSGV